MDEVAGLLDAVLGDGPGPRLWAWTDDAVVRHLDVVQVLLQRVSAARLVLIREVEDRHIPAQAGAANVAAWLAGQYQLVARAAAKSVKLAGVLHTDLPSTGSALAQGAVNVDQAGVIAAVVAGLPAGARSDVETALLVEAKQSGPKELGRCGRELAEQADPVGAQRREELRLRAAARAFDRRYFTLSEVSGTEQVRVSGRLDREDAAQVRAALDPLCSPRLNRRVRPVRPSAATGSTGTTVESGSTDVSTPADAISEPGDATSERGDAVSEPGDAGGAGPGGVDAGGASASGEGALQGVSDLRTAGQRRADALVDLCRLALACGELPDNGGDRPQINVTIPFDTLRRQIGVATLDDGGTLTAAAARRIACDAAILPAVLGGASQPLDVGRERRLFTGPIRRALILRDGGCAFPGCDRPPRWCAGHHITHWALGGPTNLTNAALVCAHHHRLLHHNGWEVRIHPTDGLPEFIPPAYIDPQQKALRNHCHHP